MRVAIIVLGSVLLAATHSASTASDAMVRDAQVTNQSFRLASASRQDADARAQSAWRASYPQSTSSPGAAASDRVTPANVAPTTASTMGAITGNATPFARSTGPDDNGLVAGRYHPANIPLPATRTLEDHLLTGLVALMLIAYQLRRKHRFLRPHHFST